MMDVLRGIPFAELQDGEEAVPVLLRAPADALRNVDAWKDFPVPGPGGQPVPFENLASIIKREDYPVISHINEQRAVTVKAFAPFGELASKTLERAKPEIEQVPLLPGWSLGYAGEERELKNSQREMARVMAVSLVLIALAMLVQFRSLMKSMVVMLTVPLGLVGAFIGLATVHASFGFMALLAIVSLAGVIVSHIIVLSDFIEEARSDGMPLEQALVQAGLVRLRAVLATVFATVCGLIPLAMSGGPLWQPLTSVHIFGLLFATLLTLLVLPVLYYLFCAKLKWMK
jgi:multidrug efflux pump subunit AcrB